MGKIQLSAEGKTVLTRAGHNSWMRDVAALLGATAGVPQLAGCVLSSTPGALHA